MLEETSERIVEHLASLADQPASYSSDGKAEARALVESLPKGGTDLASLLDLIFDDAVKTSFNTAGPGYLAYIPGGGVFPSALADLIANAINRYVGVWVAAPALVQLELNVVRWFCEIVGYGSGSGGILTSGGSLSNLTAIVTARRERLPDEFWHGTIYTSDQTHHSVRKSAVLAGFPESSVREIPTNDRQEMSVNALIGTDRSGPSRRDSSHSSSSAARGRRIRAQSTRSRRSPMSPRPRTCGSTWTVRTARSSC